MVNFEPAVHGSGDALRTRADGLEIAKPIDIERLFGVLTQWLDVTEARRSATDLPPTAPGPESAADTADIPPLDGIDIANGIKRMGGNSTLYLKILGKFHDGQADAADRIQTAADTGDRVLARREAHTLKGLAGNIGALSLYETAGQVERLFADDASNDELTPPLSTLRTELDAIMGSLSRLTARHTTPTSAQAPDIAHIRTLLTELRELLEDDDTDADRPIEALTPLLAGSPQAGLLTELAGHVDIYDFEAALDSLARLDAELVETGTDLEP